MLRKMLISKKEYIILFFITIIICMPFFISTQCIENIDTNNINALYTRMRNGGTCFDNVLPILNNNLGYGLGNFCPQLSNIIPAVLMYMLNGNIALAIKIIHFIVFYISAVMMFKLVKRVKNNKSVALATSVFYIILPYIVTDMIKNYNISKIFSLMFMPIIFYGLYELLYGSKRKFFVWFVIGYIGLIYTNLTFTLYFTFFVFLYLVSHIKKVFTLGRFASLFGSTVLVILLTFPFTAPLVDHCFLDEYYIFKTLNVIDILTAIKNLEVVLVFIISILISSVLSKICVKKEKVFFISMLLTTTIIGFIYGNIEVKNIERANKNDIELACLPSRTVQKIDYLKNRGNDILVRRGIANIENVSDNTPDLEFNVTNNNYSIIVELPRIYYLGYNITFVNENNETEELKFYINENGFVETRVIGNGNVKVTYGETSMEYVANRITLVTLTIIFISLVIYKIKYKLFKRRNIGRIKLLPKGEIKKWIY